MPGWLLNLLVSAGGALAGAALSRIFGSPVCHGDPASWPCQHWAEVCAGAGLVLAPIGVRITPWWKTEPAQQKAALKVVRFPPGKGATTEELAPRYVPVPGTNLVTDENNPGGGPTGGEG